MKNKVLVLITATLVFGLGFAVYAYNSTTTISDTLAASCCCKGDSCPMKAKGEKASTGEKSCCGDSCPVKAKGEKASADEHSCCGDSCPMKAGKAGHEGMKHGAKTAEGESCPMMKDGKMAEHHKGMDHSAHTAGANGEKAGCCACCSHSKEKKATSAI